MTRMLASVTSVEEANIALRAGADIIDLKDPARGALGALPLDDIEAIVKAVAGRCPVSATIGDLPMQPDMILHAVEEMAVTGVDIVKIGLFGQEGHLDTIRAVADLTNRQKIVAVLFADEMPDFSLLPFLADTGFFGVMLDTAHKNGKRLTDHLPITELQRFARQAKSLQLLTGLAGSLRLSDLSVLASLGVDYLGFRGALCEQSERTNALHQLFVEELALVLRQCNTVDAEVL